MKSEYDNFEFRKYTSKSEYDKALHTLEGEPTPFFSKGIFLNYS